MTETNAARSLLDVVEDRAAQSLEDAKKRDRVDLSPEGNLRDHVALILGNTEEDPTALHGALLVRPGKASLLILTSFILLKSPRTSPG
jgi:hypothetical protein